MRSQIWLVLTLLFSGIPGSYGQIPTEAPAITLNGPTYRLFFRYAGWADKKAAELAAAGKATSLTSIHIRGAGLTEDQNRSLLGEVRAFLQQVEALDARARQIIEQAHRRRPNGYLLPGQPLPPPPPELGELQQQKEQLTQDTVSRLEEALGPEAFGRLQQHARNKLGPNLKRTTVAIPPAAR